MCSLHFHSQLPQPTLRLSMLGCHTCLAFDMMKPAKSNPRGMLIHDDTHRTLL